MIFSGVLLLSEIFGHETINLILFNWIEFHHSELVTEGMIWCIGKFIPFELADEIFSNNSLVLLDPSFFFVVHDLFVAYRPLRSGRMGKRRRGRIEKGMGGLAGRCILGVGPAHHTVVRGAVVGQCETGVLRVRTTGLPHLLQV